MIPLILIAGCIFFFFIVLSFVSLAIYDIATDGPGIENIIMLLVGVVITTFGGFSINKAREYYHEKESPKTEITTSISPQIDTIITTRNSVSDTIYIYKFNLTEK